MKSFHILSLLAALTLAGTASAYDQPEVYRLKPKDHLLIMGDSTTARGIPVAGFVPLIDQAQREQLPELGAKVSGLGYDMSTSRDLIVLRNQWELVSSTERPGSRAGTREAVVELRHTVRAISAKSPSNPARGLGQASKPSRLIPLTTN